jgi:glucose-1-phosphate cytidylyltransferase
MKAVILAGGLGTRISEESHLRPKPMITIGDKPILWHIMKIYSHHGINDFIVCLGYKGYVIKEYFANYFLHMSNEDFCMTYGDGVSDVDIKASVEFHKKHKKLATVTAIQPPGRYGALDIEGEKVASFNEKPLGDGSWINGGFFVLNPSLIDKYVEDDSVAFELDPLRNLARDGQLQAWHHRGFWQAMDTLRDKNQLEDLWRKGDAPWKLWR